jgi:site-specific recombinase XerD
MQTMPSKTPTEPDDDEPGAALVLSSSSDAALADLAAPALVRWSGERAALRTTEFLTATIRNPHTRRAYARAVARFARWCAARRLPLASLRSVHVAAYIEALCGELSPVSVKQHLAALKHWLDALVVGHVLEMNPAHAVRGPRYRQTEGKTPVLEREEVRALLASIGEEDILDLRDRAMIGTMLFSFARVGALVRMQVRDYRYPGTTRAAFVLHEKGGKHHPVPAHHLAAELVDAYLDVAGLRPSAPLWQSAPGRGRQLSGVAVTERGALDILKRRCAAAGLAPDICNHSFRATGITLHQDAGGDLEAARQLAGHASVKTTQLYNRSGDRKRRAEVERIQL